MRGSKFNTFLHQKGKDWGMDMNWAVSVNDCTAAISGPIKQLLTPLLLLDCDFSHFIVILKDVWKYQQHVKGYRSLSLSRHFWQICQIECSSRSFNPGPCHLWILNIFFFCFEILAITSLGKEDTQKMTYKNSMCSFYEKQDECYKMKQNINLGFDYYYLLSLNIHL